MTSAIGVDIGGSGIKSAPVDTDRGKLLSERQRVTTPQPATPKAVTRATAELLTGRDEALPIGIGFPAVVIGGVTRTAANVDPGWIGVDAAAAFAEALGAPVSLANDADVAGLAEIRFGAGAHERGLVLFLTLGTGIGSALFLDGRLVPNTELGHIEVDGREAERDASAAVRERKKLSWSAWAARLDRYIDTVDRLLWPDLIILGGGVSKRAEKFVPLLTSRPRTIAATLQNDAGIIGAALLAVDASTE